MELKKLYENNDKNNKIIQLSLRELDMSVLVHAFLGMEDDEIDIFTRNMSQRACDMIMEESKLKKGTISKSRIEKSKNLLQQKIKYYSKMTNLSDVSRNLLKFDLSSKEKIIETFCNISEFLNHNSPLKLEDLKIEPENVLMKKGLEFLIDGWDPMLSQSILEQYKKSLLKKMETEFDMIIAGFESLTIKDYAPVLTEKLKSYL